MYNPEAYRDIKDNEYLVYVRVSTEKDEQVASVENQIAICRYWLEQNGFKWREEAVCKDKGISGTVLKEREAMQYVLQKARNREIKMVVFKSLSRLARDIKDALEIRETLHEHNARIISIEEGLDSFTVSKNDMRFEMSSLFNEQYSRMLSVNIAGVLAQKVRDGGHTGKIPYGYKRVRYDDQKITKLEIDKHTSRVVKQMFAWKLAGYGYKNITYMLNDPAKRAITQPMYINPNEDIPSPSGGKWQVTSVQRIMQNPTYKGDFVLNQYRIEKVRGRKKQLKNPRDKWTVFHNHHPAIVSPEVWEEANNIDMPHKGKRITPWNELRGMVKCAECGSNMVILQSYKYRKDGSINRWPYMKCSKYRRYGRGPDGCVNHVPLLYDDFREMIIQRVVRRLKQMPLDFRNNLERQKENKIRGLHQSLENLEQKNKDLLDLYLEKLINKEEFEQKRHQLEQEMTKIREQLQRLEKEKHSRQEIKKIEEAFEELKNRERDLHYAFKALIERIDVKEDGTTRIKYKIRF